MGHSDDSRWPAGPAVMRSRQDNPVGGGEVAASPHTSFDPRSQHPLLRVEGLRTEYATPHRIVPVVDGVTFSVHASSIVGLVGESGSGKSQTALSIMRLISAPGRIDEGSRIWLQGRDLMTAKEKEMREVRGGEAAMIFQEPRISLNPFYTIGFHLREAMRLHGVREKAEVRTRSIEALRAVGIPQPKQRLNAYPHELSGGMCQRAMIAIALICNPRLLIADEPTTALDVTIQAQILDLLKRACQARGMGVLLITHDLDVVGEYADHVLVMYRGRIVESGTTEEVLDNPKHPYTRGLLACSPRLAPGDGSRLQTIPGSPPGPGEDLRGCHFAPRCAHAFAKCEEYPPTRTVGSRSVACWLHESVDEEATT